jgi:hypothetical protein
LLVVVVQDRVTAVVRVVAVLVDYFTAQQK